MLTGSAKRFAFKIGNKKIIGNSILEIDNLYRRSKRNLVLIHFSPTSIK
jgi:hypothetical protein